MTTADYVHRLTQLVQAYRAHLAAQPDAETDAVLRRITRAAELMAGTVAPGNVDITNDLRTLIAHGMLEARTALPESPTPETATLLLTHVMSEGLWAVVVASASASDKALPKNMLPAVRGLSSLDVAIHVNEARNLKHPAGHRAEFMQRLARPNCAEGLQHLLADMTDPQRGGAILMQVWAAHTRQRPVDTTDGTSALKHLISFVAGAAVGGVIGNRTDAAVVSLFNDLSSWVTSSASASTTTPATQATGPLASPIQTPGSTVRRTGIAVIDDLPLCYVPEGEFWMGSDASNTEAVASEQPQHKVGLPSYWIGRYPITVAQFEAFVRATRHVTTREQKNDEWTWRTPRGKGSDVRNKAQHPVTCLTWHDAVAFCTWLSGQTGLLVQLPREAEWENAARGGLAIPNAPRLQPLSSGLTHIPVPLMTNPLPKRIWPWGDAFDAAKCNVAKSGIDDTTIVGRFSNAGGDSPYGCADMAGNVWEVTRSKWTENYSNFRVDADATGDEYRVLRGGAFSYTPRYARVAFRIYDPPAYVLDGLGFRVVVRAHSSS
jgi:formylglycine-generating enzyme required for sulfatase activity